MINYKKKLIKDNLENPTAWWKKGKGKYFNILNCNEDLKIINILEEYIPKYRQEITFVIHNWIEYDKFENYRYNSISEAYGKCYELNKEKKNDGKFAQVFLLLEEDWNLIKPHSTSTDFSLVTLFGAIVFNLFLKAKKQDASEAVHNIGFVDKVAEASSGNVYINQEYLEIFTKLKSNLKKSGIELGK
jgi:hypothetical protein